MSKDWKNGMIKNRIEIYEDFTLTLFQYIDKYYLDSNTLSSFNDEVIKNHYSWCYNSVCDEFKKEEIDFSNNIELKDFFYKYYYLEYYKPKEKKEKKYFINFWKKIFEMDNKNKNAVGILTELYMTFDTTINKNNY